jgi:hypothetical protein
MLVKIGDTTAEVRVEAILSGPRFGPLSNFFGWVEALMPLGIRPTLGQGALWGQVLQRTMEEWVDKCEYILTLDFDSFITQRDIEELFALAMTFQCDAITGFQVKRDDGRPMLTLKDTLGAVREGDSISVDGRWLGQPVQEVDTAHFGCTVISTAALARTPKPWFLDTPNEKGEYGDGRTDADIHFWKQFRKAGNRVFVSPRITIGHGEWVAVWPGAKLESPVFQYVPDFHANGKPKNSWRIPQDPTA